MKQRLEGLPGWLTIPEAKALEVLAKNAVVLEIGSYMGRSALAMAPVAKKLICIDHFHPKKNGQGYDPHGESALPDFNRNTAEWKDKIEVHEMQSWAAAEQDWPRLDLLFIDGGHDPKTVRGDIRLGKWVKPGGYMVFHDKTFGGVKMALDLLPQIMWRECSELEDDSLAVYQRVEGAPEIRGDDFGPICVAVPYERFVYGEFFDDFSALISGGLRDGDAYLKLRGLPTHRARNELVRAFLRGCSQMEAEGKEPFSALCFIDSDQRFKAGTLELLRSNPGNDAYDIVQAWYCTKGWPPLGIVMKKSEGDDHPFCVEGWTFDWMHIHKDFEWGDLVECDGVGGGFTIIRREVFEALSKKDVPDNKQLFFEYRNDSSEDLFFCKHAREAGFRIAVDTRITIGHIAHQPVGIGRYMQWRDGIEEGIYDETGKAIEQEGDD